MRVLVCGGRNYGDLFSEVEYLYSSLDQLNLRPLVDLLINGGANGADRCAREWANHRDIPHLCVPAPWSRKGKSAGIVRNLRMLEWRPELVVAFPGGNGTAHMTKIAVEAGVALWQPQLHEELPSQLIDQLRIPRDTV